MTIQAQILESTSRDASHLPHALATLRARYARWRLYRRTLSEMAGLSNRELADLGLHRSELKRVAFMAVYES